MKRVMPVGPIQIRGGKEFCCHLYYVNADGSTNCPTCLREHDQHEASRDNE